MNARSRTRSRPRAQTEKATRISAGQSHVKTRFWIAVASGRHVSEGLQGGFAQLGHGKEATIKPLAAGDWLVYYSPRSELEGGERIQEFTALGQIVSKKAYQAKTGRGFRPYRMTMRYRKSAKPASIRPLLSRLALTKERGGYWGIPFRQSRIEISKADFRKIARAMNFELPR